MQVNVGLANSSFLDDMERRSVRRISNIIERFRDADPTMPVQQISCLVWVALNEGRTQRDLIQALGLTSSTASRNLAALSKVHRLGKQGLDIIQWVESPEDRRAKLLYLTPNGRDFLAKILGEMR